MQEQTKYKKYKKAAQIIFWTFSLFFFIFWFKSVSPTDGMKFSFILKALILNVCFAITVYINLEFLIPRFLKNKHYIFYTFWLTITLSGMALLTQLIFIFPLNNLFDTGNSFDQFYPSVFSAFFFANFLLSTFTFTTFHSFSISFHFFQLFL